MREIAPEKLYVLGHPVAHSKSPVMHNAAYRALGLDWEYGFADCEDERLARDFLERRGWLACNVTMPWKPLAYEFASDRSDAALLAQGANVLVNWDNRIYCDNTDGKGCVSYLSRCGVRFEGARVVVCGTGPTSLAIMHACAAAGAAHISLLGRDESRVQQAVDEYRRRADSIGGDGARGAGRAVGSCFEARSYDAAGLGAISEADLVVDATPLGMKPGDPAPFDTRVLAAGQAVFDVVYGHGETALMAAARGAGCSVYDGSGMLVAQAVETVNDIAAITGLIEAPQDIDLFAVMAQAAGFDDLLR